MEDEEGVDEVEVDGVAEDEVVVEGDEEEGVEDVMVETGMSETRRRQRVCPQALELHRDLSLFIIFKTGYYKIWYLDDVTICSDCTDCVCVGVCVSPAPPVPVPG